MIVIRNLSQLIIVRRLGSARSVAGPCKNFPGAEDSRLRGEGPALMCRAIAPEKKRWM